MSDLFRRDKQVNRPGFRRKSEFRHLSGDHRAGAGERQGIGEFEEIRGEAFDKFANRPLFLFAPFMKRLLRSSEGGVNILNV